MRLAVWLKRMGVMHLTPHLIGALGIFRQRIGSIHTGVVTVVALPHFPVNAVQHRVAGNFGRVIELGGRLLLLKRKACRDLTIEIHNTLLKLFLWNLRFGLFQLFDSLVCFPDGRRKLRGSTLLLGKLQPGCAFCHRTSPHSHENWALLCDLAQHGKEQRLALGRHQRVHALMPVDRDVVFYEE